MSSTFPLQRLAGSSWARWAADLGLGLYAGRRVAALDRRNLATLQHQTLRRLVHTARDTQFGRDHGFAHIRSVTDYQDRVPLRDYEAFWQTYWKSSFPRLDNVTWPGLIPYLALSSGTTSGATKYIPVSWEMAASNRRAALTTLALFRHSAPESHLFRGRVFFLGGSTDLASPVPGVQMGDLSGIAAREVPEILRPYTYPPLEVALQKDWEEKLTQMARESIQLPITAVSGVPSWLLALFDRVRALTGKERLVDAWPSLRLVIHGGTRFDPYRRHFENIIGSKSVCFQEVYPASEGYIAVEDPRYHLLRLIPDHGLFFEFVPVEELSSNQPRRHTAATVELGVNYAVVLTTCAGLWSYVLGDTVCFERRDPPLLRFTGRTRYFLSAFGEHLISEEVERAVAEASEACAAVAVDFHVGPVFPEVSGRPGHHQYLVEFAHPPQDLRHFASCLDRNLQRINEDYAAHRVGDLTMGAPEVVQVPRGGFADWLRSKGKLGGQHKVPRMDNSGVLTAELRDHVCRRLGLAEDHPSRLVGSTLSDNSSRVAPPMVNLPAVAR